MTAFTYKGYGRIYTDREYIKQVEKIVEELDEFEWGYYPAFLVTSWDQYPNVEYVGKFELDEKKFKEICKEWNIPVFVFNSYNNEYPRGYVKTLTKDEIQQLSYGELK